MAADRQTLNRRPAVAPPHHGVPEVVRHLGVGAVFGALGAATVLLFAGRLACEPTGLASLFLFAAALYLPTVGAAAALATLLVLCSMTEDALAQFALVRIASTIGIYLLFRRRWSELSLVFVAALTWQMALLLPPLIARHGWHAPLSTRTAITIPLELVMIVLLIFIGLLPPMRRRFAPPLADLGSYFMHLFLLPLYFAAALSFCGARWLGGMSAVAVVERVNLTNRSVAIGALGLFVAALLLSVVLSNVVSGVISIYVQTALSFRRGRPEIPFADAAAELDAIAESAERLIACADVVAQLVALSGAEPDSLANLWRVLEERTRLIERAAFGTLVCSPSGTIRFCSRSAARLIGANDTVLEGRSIRELERYAHPWARELADFVAISFQGSERSRRRCSAIDGQSLMVEFHALAAEGATTHAGRLAGGAALFLFPVEDHQEFASQVQVPTEFEKLGSITSELLERFGDRIGALALDLTAARREFDELPGRGRMLGEAEQTYADSLNRLSVEMVALEKELEREQARCRLNRRYCETIVISSLFAEAVRFVGEILRYAEVLPVLLISGVPSENQAEPISIVAPRSEAIALTRYLVLLLRNILPLAPNCELALDYEQIGSNTASLLPGASAGRYARLVMAHPKQFVSSNIVAVQQETSIGVLRDSPDSVELTLQLVTQQIKRMGGFVSVQSSALKGTAISLYIPTDMTTMARLSKRERRRIERGRVEIQQSGETRVLIVSECDGTGEQLKNVAGRLGCEVVLCDPEQLVTQLVTPVDFSGLGFEDEGQRHRGSGKQSTVQGPVDIAPFQLVLFSLSRANYETLALLESIEAEAPEKTKIALVNETDLSRLQLLKTWELLCKPLDDEQLIERIMHRVRQKPRIEEHVFAPEDEDSFGGSGF